MAVTEATTTDEGELPVVAGRASVVIPARNEAAFIEKCLECVRSQGYPDLEIIVVDGASTDATAQIVREIAGRDKRVHLVENPRAITPTSLNAGLAAATGEWFVRIDAHATVSGDYLKRA